MAVPEMERQWISKFQENLSIIRKVAGWTTQELADELGVARQTVSNLETGRSPMSKLQYLALRTVFNAEIARSENRDLAKVIKTLVDDPLEGVAAQKQHMADSTEVEGRSGAVAPTGDRVDMRTAASSSALSTAMQVLTVVTGALASGAAAGALAFFMFPDGTSGKR